MEIYKYDTLNSTNTTAMGAEYGHGDVVVADRQTAGRGQRGNRWEAAVGQNLTFSVVVEPLHLAPGEQFVLSMIAALAVYDTLGELGICARLKWPNDVYVGDAKIAGILIENQLMGAHAINKSVIGVGLNVNQREFVQMEVMPTSVALCAAGSHGSINDRYDCAEILDRFLRCFAVRYAMDVVQLHADYMAVLWRRDGVHRYRDAASGEVFTASIYAIDPHSGQLTLQVCEQQGVVDPTNATPSGELRNYWFKEVSSVL